MKITQMVMDKKNNNKIHIFVDNEYFVNLDAEVVFSLGLKKDKELDLETLDKIDIEQKSVECYNKATTFLSRGAKTRKQTKDYLFQKGYRSDIIEKCLMRFERVGIIDDDLYTKRFIEQERKKKGKNAIIKSLVTKGIPKEIIDNNISEFSPSYDTIKMLEKKYMRNKPYDSKNIIKLKRYLLGKGFMYDEINSVIGDNDESRN